MTRAKDISKIVTDADLSGTLDVTGEVNLSANLIVSSTNARIRMFETDTTDLNTQLQTTSGDFNLSTLRDDASLATTRIKVDHSTGDISFYEDTGTTAKLFWDASTERLGIGTTSPSNLLHVEGAFSTTTQGVVANFDSGNDGIGSGPIVKWSNDFVEAAVTMLNTASGASALTFETMSSSSLSEAMRIDTSGNLLVGGTTFSQNSAEKLSVFGRTGIEASAGIVLGLDRQTSDGEIIQFRKDNGTVGSIGSNSGDSVYIGNGVAGLRFRGVGFSITPFRTDTGANYDNALDLGVASVRFDDIYATNGTIQTSDQNEKNTITDSDLGIDFIKRLTPKSYIFNGKTRTHYGLIAQDVENVLSDISKPTSGFAGFIKTDISEEQDGSQYRYGLRYTEFVAPLIQAVKDQQAIIEDLQARITALENAE